jgi:hypothetical protein
MTTIDRTIIVFLISILIAHNGSHVNQHVALIALELEAAIAAFLNDQFKGLSLAVQRISGDATNFQHPDQLAQRKNLTANLGALRNTQAQACAMSQGRQDIHIRLFGCLVKPASHFLAIDDNSRLLPIRGGKVSAKFFKTLKTTRLHQTE